MKRLFLIAAVVTILVLPNFAGASNVLDVTDSFSAPDIETYSFIADQTPLKYLVALTDFNFLYPFDTLSVLITQAGNEVTRLLSPGTKTFDAEIGLTYFATVAGIPSAPPGGTFNLNITAVPIPQGLTLMVSGLFAIVFLRRRLRKG